MVEIFQFVALFCLGLVGIMFVYIIGSRLKGIRTLLIVLGSLVVCFIGIKLVTMPLVSKDEAVSIAREEALSHTNLTISQPPTAIISEIGDETPAKVKEELAGLDYWIVGIEFESTRLAYAEVYVDARTGDVIDGRLHNKKGDGSDYSPPAELS